MKKPLLTLALAAIHFNAFAQGKVMFGNDANHLIVISPTGAVNHGRPELAGLPAPQMGRPGDVMSTLTAQLFAGTAPDSLTLQSAMTPAGLSGFEDGHLRNVAVTLTGIAGGVNAYFQILIWETTAGSFANASRPLQGYWYASTPVFSGVTGDFSPTVLTSLASWTPGPILLEATIIPEPSTYVLVGLGVASLLLFRRSK